MERSIKIFSACGFVYNFHRMLKRMNFVNSTFATLITAHYHFIVSNFDVCNLCKHCNVSLDFLPIESLCLNDGSSSDESSDDEPCMTVEGNLYEVEQFQTLYTTKCFASKGTR